MFCRMKSYPGWVWLLECDDRMWQMKRGFFVILHCRTLMIVISRIIAMSYQRSFLEIDQRITVGIHRISLALGRARC